MGYTKKKIFEYKEKLGIYHLQLVSRKDILQHYHALVVHTCMANACPIAIHVVMPSWYVGSMRCFPDCWPAIPLVYLFSSFGVLKFMLEKHYFLRWILIKQEKKKSYFIYSLILPKMLIKYYIKRA